MTIHEEIKASEYILYSDAEILIALDFDPISKGHILIMPQEFYLDIDEIPEPILRSLFKAAQAYVKLLKSKFSLKGYSMMQNGGEFNDINVFHLHVFPRFKEDEFGHKSSNNIEKIDVQKLRKMMGLEMELAEI